MYLKLILWPLKNWALFLKNILYGLFLTLKFGNTFPCTNIVYEHFVYQLSLDGLSQWSFFVDDELQEYNTHLLALRNLDFPALLS